MLDLVTLGESLLVFSPIQPGPLRYAVLFTKSVAGAETNVAVVITRMGLRAGWIGRVGDDELGRYLLSSIRGEGVDTSRVIVDPEAPTGLYLKEARRPGEVHIYYYRKGSAGSRLGPQDVDPSYIANSRALYVSGITSALGEQCHAAVMKAVQTAQEHNIPVYFDPNYRSKLWSADAARRAWLQLLPHCDVLLPSTEEAQILVGAGSPEEMAQRLLRLGPRLVLLKTGEEGVWDASDASLRFVGSPRRGHVVDPVGAGDAFSGGFIAGQLRGLDALESARLGALLASYAVEALGDTQGIPTYKELTEEVRLASDVHR